MKLKGKKGKAAPTKTYGLFIPKQNEVCDLVVSQNSQPHQTVLPHLPQSGLVKNSRKEMLIKRQQAEIIASDPHAFSYDDVFDDMQTQRDAKAIEFAVKKKTNVKKSKYIGSLLEQSKIREVENDRIRERLLLKERETDDALYGEKEKFVTSAYKAKLIESQRWEKEDERLALLEKANDVTKLSDGLGSFYSNLTTKNIAMGSDVNLHATSAYTVGRKEGVDKRSIHKTEDDSAPLALKRRKETRESHDNDMVDVGLTQTDAIIAVDDHIDVRPLVQLLPVVSSLPSLPSKKDMLEAAKARYLARKK